MLNNIREIFHGQWKHLSPDGVFGRGTRDAVKQFQIYANISVTGVLDENTQANIQIKNRDAKRGYSYYKAPIANYQPANANYTAGIATSNPAKNVSPQTDTSSWVDSEWKSLGKDIMSIIEEIFKKIDASCLSDAKAMQRFIKENFEKHSAELQRLRKQLDARYKTQLAMVNKSILDERSRMSETTRLMDDILSENAKELGVEHKPSPQAQNYHNALDTKATIEQNMQKARAALKEQGNKSLKEIQRTANQKGKEAAQLLEKGKVAKNFGRGVAVLNWGINVGTAGYYIFMAVTAATEEERDQYLKKLKDTIATTVIDVGITVGTNVAVRFAAGSAAGPAGIIAVSIYTAVDVIFLCATGESLSTHIWHFIQSIDWERAQVYYDYAYMGLNGRRSYGPKY
ncbi:MAG: peptidoglycan-binding protein [Prevotella sp.]|nr:peptidoglycan-binding protein [Prevotella sp.]